MAESMNRLLSKMQTLEGYTDTLSDQNRYVQEAMVAYNKALSINPLNASAWNNKGTVLGFVGKNEEAVKCFDTALKIDPHAPMAHRNKGWALAGLGRWEEAIECYDEVLELNSYDEDIWNLKSVALYKLGRYEEALDAVKKALEINPIHSQALGNKRVYLENIQKQRPLSETEKEELERLKPKGLCIVATVSGCDSLTLASCRKIRDDFMTRTSIGRHLIRNYYKFSPYVIVTVLRFNLTKRTIKEILTKFSSILSKNENT